MHMKSTCLCRCMYRGGDYVDCIWPVMFFFLGGGWGGGLKQLKMV